MIYEQVYNDTITGCEVDIWLARHDAPTAALTLTSPQIRHESLPYFRNASAKFWQTNAFIFTVAEKKHASDDFMADTQAKLMSKLELMRLPPVGQLELHIQGPGRKPADIIAAKLRMRKDDECTFDRFECNGHCINTSSDAEHAMMCVTHRVSDEVMGLVEEPPCVLLDALTWFQAMISAVRDDWVRKRVLEAWDISYGYDSDDWDGEGPSDAANEVETSM